MTQTRPPTESALLAHLRQRVERGELGALDLARADWALRHGGNDTTALAFALAGRAVADGHAYYALGRRAEQLEPLADLAPTDEELATAFADPNPLVGRPGDDTRPLILDGDRLYLHRYWQYETALATRLCELVNPEPSAVDLDPLLPGGDFEYGGLAPGEPQWQAVAAFVALRHRFAVISGGPGTGKTYTVVRIMAAMVRRALENGDPPPVFALAAPTGKAAGRMAESVQKGIDELNLTPTQQQHLGVRPRTLHRLLGLRPNTTHPRHDRDQPIPADVIIVDEASMIDLPMMAKLAAAVAHDARLILLGDQHQLASVESGAVLAELCGAGGENAFSADQIAAAGELLPGEHSPGGGPLADHVVTLKASHRFGSDSRIGRVAREVNAGNDAAALAAAGSGDASFELDLVTNERHLHGRLKVWLERLRREFAELANRHGTVADQDAAASALAALHERCVLCPMHYGPAGAATVNQRLTAALATRSDGSPGDRWYPGRPVIIQRNDYRSGLANGDVGICLRDQDGELRVWFPGEAGPRALLPTALPEHATAYAMTVHKSQGSEFDRVILLLPEKDTPVLTRELIYTGITRARSAVHIVGPEAILRQGIRRQTQRWSTLADRLGDSA